MKAFTISDKSKVFAYSEPVNMSRSFPGLTRLIVEKLKKKPESGDLYFFVNKRKNYVKIFFWQSGGFCIFAKKLPHGIFDSEGLPEHITIGQMQQIVDKVIIGLKKRSLKAA